MHLPAATLTSTGNWLLEKYGTMYGVHSTYRRLVFLDYLARKYRHVDAHEREMLRALVGLLQYTKFISTGVFCLTRSYRSSPGL